MTKAAKKHAPLILQENELESESINELENQDLGELDNSSLIEIGLTDLPINVTLPCTIYLKANEKILVFRRQGEKLNYKTAFEMQKKGTERVLIHSAFWELFKRSVETPNLGSQKNSVPSSLKMDPADHMQQLLMSYGQELEKRLREPKGPMFEKLKQTAGAISKLVGVDIKLGEGLLRKAEDSSLYFVNHSVNTSIYAAIIAKRLGFSQEDIDQVTYATLVHDMGYLFLPKRILYKVSALSPDEKITFQSHPKQCAELLHSVNTTGAVMRAVLQHHENLDGTGFPSGLKGDEIHVFAKIIAVADMYDDLTSNRPQERAISKAEAIKKMNKMGNHIDVVLVGLLPTE